MLRLRPTTTILRSIVFTFAALLLPSVCRAVDPEWVSFCQRYANDAVGAAKKNIDRKCGFRGPRWTTNREDHFNWCLSQGGVYAEPAREGLYRVKGLKDCELHGRVIEKQRNDVILTAPDASATPAILSAQNGYRAKHCVPNLTWSAELAAGAQAWASACKSNGQGGFVHSAEAWSSESGFGENLFWGTGATATNAVDWWYAEIRNYNFAVPIWDSSVSHFTQVVWRNSAQVGCAMATCDGLNLWVCRYSPTGNWNTNQPSVLTNNVPQPCK
jgi:pathogenesis-related protein 1